MSEEMFTRKRSVLVDQLAKLYHTEPLAVANVCDGAVDRSGRLLGEVRDRHATIYKDLTWWQKMAWQFDQWRRTR